jgi:hypothetical protein
MVQNKDIEATTSNGVCKTNGVHNDPEEGIEESEDEDDYLDYLLVVPSLDKSVKNRNMSLISESLMNFFTTIESRKGLSQKIKEEIIDNYAMPSVVKAEEKIQETIVEDPKETIKNEFNESEVVKNEVTTNDDHCEAEIPVIKSQCILKMWKATFGEYSFINVCNVF